MDKDFEKFKDDFKNWVNNGEGDYQHPEGMETEMEFSIRRNENNAHIQISKNKFYNDNQIVRFLERLIKEKKLPLGYKTTGEIILGLGGETDSKALIEYYEYSENNEPSKRRHIIISRNDYSI